MESKLSQCQKNELALGSVSVASEKQFVWTIEGATNRTKYRQKPNVQTEFSHYCC